MALIKTFSGRMFPLVDPKPEDIYIEDIATGLSNTCRFSGQLAAGFYSVAQHCVLVSSAVPSNLALQGLLHDAGESYLGDLTQPLKAELISRGEHGYRLIENGIMEAVAARFGINARKPPEVAEADLRMFATEARDLMRGGLADYISSHTMELLSLRGFQRSLRPSSYADSRCSSRMSLCWIPITMHGLTGIVDPCQLIKPWCSCCRSMTSRKTGSSLPSTQPNSMPTTISVCSWRDTRSMIHSALNANLDSHGVSRQPDCLLE
jgi:hypothetical protein